MQSLIDDTIAALEDLRDEERKRVSKWYYPTAQKVIGVKNPDYQKVAGELRKNLKKNPPGETIEFCIALVETDIFECQQVAYDILSRSKPLLRAIDKKQLGRLGRNLDNWVSVDFYCTKIYGPKWREGLVSDKEIIDKTQSADKWERRAALVSTVALNLKSSGGTGDASRTLAVCERLVDDKDEHVAKALSWALRQLLQHDVKAVLDFLDAHYDRLPALVRREVEHKAFTGLKNGYKRNL